MKDAVITLDIDWAPDFVIDFVAAKLLDARVHATWFVTHASPGIDRLRAYPNLFELGIHPNFLPGSTQGRNQQEVVDSCIATVPDATSMRAHSLVQSSPTYSMILKRTAIRVDCSLFLPRMPHIRPVEFRIGGRQLLRVPYFWEDDEEMEYEPPVWTTRTSCFQVEGLKVFNFHPIHVYLNSPDLREYTALKTQISDLKRATPAQVAQYVHAGRGTRTIFDQVLHDLSGSETRTIDDLYNDWIAGGIGRETAT